MALPDTVAAGVTAHAKLDTELAQALRAAQALAKVYEKAIGEGLFPALAAKSAFYEAPRLAGLLAEAGALSAALHIEATKAAKAAGVDTGSLAKVGDIALPPQPKSGGR